MGASKYALIDEYPFLVGTKEKGLGQALVERRPQGIEVVVISGDFA